MTLKEVTIDSVRPALIKGEWAIILKGKDSEQYLPIYVGPSQANIVKSQLLSTRFPDQEIYERFLTGADIAGAVLKSVTVNGPENGVFHAILLLTVNGNSLEMECPVVGALALSFRRKAPILSDESSFLKVGIAPLN
jgi:bifunctional DNase/RNase